MTRLVPLAALVLTSACTVERNVGDTTGDHPYARPVFQTPRWALALGNTGDDIATGVAIDPGGDVVAGGIFQGAVDFGGDTLTAPTATASWLSKRAGADGSEVWARSIGSDAASLVTVSDVGTAADGTIVVAGTYAGDFTLDGLVLHGPPVGTDTWDAFVAALDGDGHARWLSGLGAASNATEQSLAVGADGRVAMTAAFAGTVALPSGAVSGGSDDVILADFDPSGALAWGIAIRNDQMNGPATVALTSEDDVLLGGALTGTSAIAGTSLTAAAEWSAYVARFTFDGHLEWAHELGDSATLERPCQVAVGPGNTLVLATTSIPTHPESDAWPTSDPEVAALDAGGGAMWTASVAADESTSAFAILGGGTSVATGHTALQGPAPSDLPPAGMFLIARDDAGHTLDSTIFLDGAGAAAPVRMAARGGAFAISGYFGGAADLGTGPLRYVGGGDAFVVMMDAAP